MTKPQKIFCIGLNKTGTTSLESFFRIHNYRVGNQVQGEELLSNYFERDFSAIGKFCRSAEAFQDVPLSLPFLYIYLDQEFQGSKFILTVRDSPDQWYDSITSFHSRITETMLPLPSYNELKEFEYHDKGWLLKYLSVYNTPSDDLYHKETLTQFYDQHTKNVQEYFKAKNNLLVINVAVDEDVQNLSNFLGIKPKLDTFPKENITRHI